MMTALLAAIIGAAITVAGDGSPLRASRRTTNRKTRLFDGTRLFGSVATVSTETMRCARCNARAA